MVPFVASCTLPGATLGTYDVRGALQSDGCGGAPNPWTFSVMLTKDGATLYWNWMDASPILSGTILPGGQVTLSGFQLANVDSTATQMGPCDLRRDDDLELSLGAKSPPSSFGGTISYSFSPQTGANCSDQLTTAGGTYETLPCTIEYVLAGVKQ